MLPEKISSFHFRIFTGMLLLRVSSFMCAEFFYLVKGTLSSLRQCLATKGPLKIIKNAFYFTLKALFILNIFKFLPWIFGHIKQLDSEDKVNFKIYDVATWLRSNANTHINQYLDNEAMKFGQFMEYVTRKIFLEKSVFLKKSPCLILCMIFEKISFSCYILLPDQGSLSGCLHEILGNICILIVC